MFVPVANSFSDIAFDNYRFIGEKKKTKEKKRREPTVYAFRLQLRIQNGGNGKSKVLHRHFRRPLSHGWCTSGVAVECKKGEWNIASASTTREILSKIASLYEMPGLHAAVNPFDLDGTAKITIFPRTFVPPVGRRELPHRIFLHRCSHQFLLVES